MLCDERFGTTSNTNSLSAWLRPFLASTYPSFDHTLTNLNQFIKGISSHTSSLAPQARPRLDLSYESSSTAVLLTQDEGGGVDGSFVHPSKFAEVNEVHRMSASEQKAYSKWKKARDSKRKIASGLDLWSAQTVAPPSAIALSTQEATQPSTQPSAEPVRSKPKPPQPSITRSPTRSMSESAPRAKLCLGAQPDRPQGLARVASTASSTHSSSTPLSAWAAFKPKPQIPHQSTHSSSEISSQSIKKASTVEPRKTPLAQSNSSSAKDTPTHIQPTPSSHLSLSAPPPPPETKPSLSRLISQVICVLHIVYGLWNV